jgi:hypothetical protein
MSGDKPIKVVIRKLTANDFAKINAYAKDNPIQQVIGMVFRGLVEPKFNNLEQVGELPMNLTNEIAMYVASYSGLTEEEAERMRRFLGQTEPS